MGRSIQKATGTQWKFISFAGGNPEALVNLLGGNVDFILTNPANLRDHLAKGAVRVLLAGTPKRLPEFKDVRTIKEAGMGDHVPAYRGVLGPPNMPDYAVKKVEEAMKKVTESDRFKRLGTETGMQILLMPSSEYGAWLDDENDRMKSRLSDFGMLKK
jgi:putative tricarboxylic transport membrane protein